MKKHLFAIILIFITCVAWAVSWPHLPETMAIHWSGEEANGFATKFNAMLLTLGIMIVSYGLLIVIPKVDPRKTNYDKFSKSFTMISYSILFVLFLVNILVLATALGYKIPMNSAPNIIVGILFLVIGNYLPQCKPNFFIGIRNAWTLSNEEVWRKTHRFSGKVFVVVGLMMIISIFAPAALKSFLMLGIIIGAVALTMLYSYFVYKKEMGI
ncbi:SdpI family protein [Bacillus sp. NPDC094106]|uniref:SdpI family protein n=1 Tax=Bacillus sp. NPDC094106 TaxID=3363949 RepID=UPI0038222D9E